MIQDIKKICEYCDKEFVISQESQKEALKKGGKIDRKYCNGCLLRWRKGEIKLESSKQ
jgi:Pyruvate/2-oxoacid:ferredoxin oxidoreductase delta subunit